MSNYSGLPKALLSIFGGFVMTGSERHWGWACLYSVPSQNGVGEYNRHLVSEISSRVKYSLRSVIQTACHMTDVTVPEKVKTGPKGSVSTLRGRRGNEY